MAALLGTWKTDSSTTENYDAWAKQSGRNFVSMIICIFKIFVGGFLRVLWFPPPIILTATI
jgi:hypothetical protein